MTAAQPCLNKSLQRTSRILGESSAVPLCVPCTLKGKGKEPGKARTGPLFLPCALTHSITLSQIVSTFHLSKSIPFCTPYPLYKNRFWDWPVSGNDGLKLGNGYTLVLAVAAPEDSDADAGGAASVAARVKISATFELGAEPSGACPPGHFSARGAWPQCTPCLKGTFPDSRHVACWPCPYGLTTAGAGATSFVECNLKPDDPLARYSTVSLAVHMRMHVCVRGRGERERERERERKNR